MAMWSDEKISDADLLEMLPTQCIPDIEGMKLRIGEKALHICGDDADWALQSDISLATGQGCMVFFYAGELLFRLEGPKGTEDRNAKEAQQKGLPRPEELRLIKRGKPWEFIFSAPESNTLRIYADITNVSWRPNEKE